VSVSGLKTERILLMKKVLSALSGRFYDAKYLNISPTKGCKGVGNSSYLIGG